MFKKIVDIVKKYNLASNTVNNINGILDYRIRFHQLQHLALNSTDSIVSKRDLEAKQALIVSFTTYSKRIHDAPIVVESLAQQTLKADRVILWLDETEFTLDNIPCLLKKQQSRGLEIRFCKNLRSYKKLIPTLELCPDADIITVDDDVIYPIDMIEALYREHLEYPDCVICNRAHKVKYDENNHFLPYPEWDFEVDDDAPSKNIFPVGVGGIYYPANILSENCLSESLYMELAPRADDVWFKAMTVLNGKLSKKVKDDRKFNDRFLVIDENQDIALFRTNLHESDNDKQIKAVYQHFNLL